LVGYMAPIPPEDAEALIKQGYDPAFDRIGVDGIEYFLNNELAGKRGSQLREVDVAGATIRQLEQVDPVPGQNVRLTIDVELQKAAEDALRNELTLLNSTYKKVVSQQGVIVAMNPQNGQILAMVSYPGYDNSKFARNIDVNYYEQVVSDPLKPLINNAIRSLYPPGSTWKLITASGALQENVISPNSVLDDPGRLVVENKYAPNDPAASQTFVCWKRDGHGLINMIGAIANSCNVYFYQVGGGNPDVPKVTLREGGLGIEDLFRYATAYGIGTELGVELPSENRGRMPDRTWKRVLYGENWSTGDTYNAALGQGYVNVTPLQLVSMAATVANGGTLYQPTIIDSFLDPEGKVVQPFTPHVLRNVNIDNLTGTLKLLLVEDMIMKGPDSLDCICESDSPYYNGVRCNPATYRNTVDLSVNQDGSDIRDYQVFIPQNYTFNAQMCTPLRFNDKYRPAFVSGSNIDIVRQGMRAAVTVGTATKANLPYVEVAGKTGTAQYCDNIANGLGLCKFGSWPAHAWFIAFAPYKNPEIVIAGFIYNGVEGSTWALPMVRQTLEAYYRLKNARAGIAPPPAADSIPLPATPVPTSTPTGG
nr:hypothetical protein [Anaerolineae bacterium]